MAFKMNTEEKQKVINALSSAYGDVTLTCDGYRVDLQVQRSVGLNFRVMIYVNRCFKGEWSLPESTAPERKFLRPVKKTLISAAKIKEIERRLGKKAIKAFVAEHQKVWAFAAPDFASGRAAINHLCKVCDSILVES